jgi:hypothetical protein
MKRQGSIVSVLIASLAVVLGSGCPEEEEPNHGYVKLHLSRAANQDESPFGGTDSIRVNLRYGDAGSPCLIKFYEQNPNWAIDGADGAPVFEEWETKVCEIDPSQDAPVPCEFATITQRLGEVPTLTLEYEVPGDDIENHVLIAGPLPTAKLADCAGGTAPTVSLQGGDVSGFGSSGSMIWQGTSAPEPVAQTGQGLPLKVRIAAL